MSYIYIYIYIYGTPILDVSRSHTTTQHSRQDSAGRVISSSQRPLPDNTRHSQQTNIHAPGGIRTHDLSRRAAVFQYTLESLIHFCSKTNQMHNFSSLLNISLHVSDGLSIHHQEFKTVLLHTASGICHICSLICRVKLKKLKKLCIQLVLLQKYIKVHGPVNTKFVNPLGVQTNTSLQIMPLNINEEIKLLRPSSIATISPIQRLFFPCCSYHQDEKAKPGNSLTQ